MSLFEAVLSSICLPYRYVHSIIDDFAVSHARDLNPNPRRIEISAQRPMLIEDTM